MRKEFQTSGYYRGRAAEFSAVAEDMMGIDLRRQYLYLADQFAKIAAGLEGGEAFKPQPECEHDE